MEQMTRYSEWSATEWLAGAVEANSLAQELGFRFVTIPSMAGAFELARERTRGTAFVALSETTDGGTWQGQGGGFFRRKAFTAYILMRYDVRDEAQRMARLRACRALRDQLYSRLVRDHYERQDVLPWTFQFDLQERDTPTFSFDGLTGTMFNVVVDSPVDLTYNADEWNG